MTVFSLAIGYLRQDLLDTCNRKLKEDKKDQGQKDAGPKIEGTLTSKDARWVLTVPAIWNDVAKQFMREAAEKVQFSSTQRFTFA